MPMDRHHVAMAVVRAHTVQLFRGRRSGAAQRLDNRRDRRSMTVMNAFIGCSPWRRCAVAPALINHMQGAVKAGGGRLPRCSALSFAGKVQAHIRSELTPGLRAVLEGASVTMG